MTAPTRVGSAPMKIIDRHIARHFIGPFCTGVAAFVAILLGVDQMYQMVQLIMRDGIPLGTVLQVFLLRMPMVIALTMPMATVFAALMSSGELSSHGEVTAMRAGGVTVLRMALPVCVAGCAVSVLAFVFNEALGPASSRRATALVDDFVSAGHDPQRPLMLRIPEHGPVERIVYADSISILDETVANVSIIEFDRGKPREVFFAERAEWRGHDWLLHDVVHKQDTGLGYREQFIATVRYDIGRSLQELRAGRRSRPEDMSLGELRDELAQLRAAAEMPGAPRDDRRMWKIDQHIAIRVAVPWAALCFAILGFPLGLRPQRTSTGVGFGISLAIIFVYYITINVLRAFGEQGVLAPALAAWAPNALLLAVGIGLLLEAGR